MTIAQAVESLEVSAETGGCNSEAVATLRSALELRESRQERRAWRMTMLERLKVMRVSSTDVLVLRLPPEVIADADQLARAQAAARDIADVARRGVVLLEEGAPLTAEPVPDVATPKIHVPPVIPPYLQPGTKGRR